MQSDRILKFVIFISQCERESYTLVKARRSLHAVSVAACGSVTKFQIVLQVPIFCPPLALTVRMKNRALTG